MSGFSRIRVKVLSGMANRIDPDQTAVWSGSALFAYAILSEFFYNIYHTVKTLFG